MPNLDDLFSPQPRKETPFDKDAWAARKQEERERVYAKVDSYAVSMGSNGDLFRTFLDVQARFDRYSVSNAILIADQMPQARRLADFESWRSSGVYVKKGAVGVSILEPGKEYEREDGSIGVSYQVKKVFDISQTNSRQRPAPTAVRDQRLLMKALMNNAPCRFALSDTLPEGVNATYHAEDNVILVRQGLDATVLFQSLAQEVAYVHLTKGGYLCQAPAFLAKNASYMLCRRNGISVENFSFARMPEAYRTMDAQSMRAEAGVVREVAGEISADMNRVLTVQDRSHRQRDDGAR